MTAKAPITIPEITWTFAARNIAASKVAVFYLVQCRGTAKNHHESEYNTMTKFVFAKVDALLKQKLNPYLKLIKTLATWD